MERSAEAPGHNSIAQEIIDMAQADQEMRTHAISEGGEWDSGVDRRNTARLKAIIDQIGWPTKQKVGDTASHAAWLLAQHADDEPDFQAHCLDMMKALPELEAERPNIAYLEDRVRVNKGLPQLYGTQFYYEGSQFGPRPVEEPDDIETRRTTMGLEPFSDYYAGMMKMYGQKP